MGEMVVKGNVRFRKKDAERTDLVGIVRTKVSEAEADETEEEATKVAEPAVTKVREPSTTKRRGSGSD